MQFKITLIAIFISMTIASTGLAQFGFNVGMFLKPRKVVTCPAGYIVVPALAGFTSSDFCVMQYEAKQVNGLATSQAAGVPWTDSFTHVSARAACAAVGAHLINNEEWMSIARNIEAQTINDIDAASGIQLATGNSDTNPRISLASDGVDPYYGTGDSAAGAYSPGFAGKAQKRTHTLSNGSVIWDFSGNAWERVDYTCTSTTPWYVGGTWLEWTNTNLAGWIKTNFGPAGAINSANGAGKYVGCSYLNDVMTRGVGIDAGATAGLYAIYFRYDNSTPGLAFRCAITP